MSSIATRPLTALHPHAATSILLPLRLWHLLSLDAPTVAVLWMLFLSRSLSCGTALHASWPAAAALFLTVWVLYVGDRLLDARQTSAGVLHDRHLFHLRHRRVLLSAVVASVPLLLALVLHLPAHLRTAWLLLSIPLLFYAVVIHRTYPARLPKELCVALLFAAATAMPILVTHPGLPRPMIQTALFAAVCWMNCIAIARWEGLSARTPARIQSRTPSRIPTNIPTSTARTTYWGARHLPWVGIILIASCAVCILPLPLTPRLTQAQGFALPPLACICSAAFLLLLHAVRHRIRPVELRGLADAALLTPLLLWPLLRA